MNKKERNEILNENKKISIVKEITKKSNTEVYTYEKFVTIGMKGDKAMMHHRADIFDLLYSIEILEEVIRKIMSCMTPEQRANAIKHYDEVSQRIQADGGVKVEKEEK